MTSERTADASDLMKQALDVPFTFDLLRDPEWQPTRENYAALRDAIAEVVARNQQLQEALAEREGYNGIAHDFLTVQCERDVLAAQQRTVLETLESVESGAKAWLDPQRTSTSEGDMSHDAHWVADALADTVLAALASVRARTP